MSGFNWKALGGTLIKILLPLAIGAGSVYFGVDIAPPAPPCPVVSQ